ncbi:uncharacterized protein LOC124156917 [Ischnura elegans]|uniref:uncharacterized protein LOC124156917 n=1 Tax=Ischnura elegans TaxID=197161 RepID=UPI001ED88433|nr:uncharacterized protein LOC124156917 [Ischnura elegans]
MGTRYKYCFVPGCTNTSIKEPNKRFICLPTNTRRRQLWLKAIRRNPKDISSKTVGFICEDHFNLEEDLENFIKFKYYGGLLRVKKEVVPHRFKWQPNRITEQLVNAQTSTHKRVEMELLSHQSSAVNQDNSSTKGLPPGDQEELSVMETCPPSPRRQRAAEALCMLSKSSGNVGAQTSYGAFTPNDNESSCQVSVRPSDQRTSDECSIIQARPMN